MIDAALIERLMARFAGLDKAYGTYVLDGRRTTAGKVTGKPATIRGPVTRELWEEHLAGRKPLGIVPIREDNNCVWGCIDIDTYPLDHVALISKIRAAKLPLLTCRSKSGGAHLFLFATEPVPAETMQRRLREMAAALGWGRSEVFPKQTQLLVEKGDIGNWLNMPYAGNPTTRYGIKPDGTAMSLAEFLDAADSIALSPADLDQTTVPEAEDEFKDGPPCLQILAKQGFPQGTRNNGLYHLGVYYKRVFPEDGAWREHLERANRTYMDPPLPSDEVQTVIKSLSRKDYQYKCNDQPAANFCNASLCRMRKYGVGDGVGVEIRNLTKLMTEPAIWFVDVNGRRLECSSEEIMSQYRFQRRCLDKLSILPPTMKNDAWQALIRDLLANVDEREIPAMEDPNEVYIGRFVRSRPCKEGQPRQDIFLKRAVLYKGKYWFRFEDLMDWVRVNKLPLERQQAYKTLTVSLKAEHCFWNLHKHGRANVYGIDASRFADTEPEEALEAPDQEGQDAF